MSKFLVKLQNAQKKAINELRVDEQRQLAKAETKIERERVKADILKKKLAIQREVAEAKTALIKAEAAKKRAKKELQDVEEGRLWRVEKKLKAGVATKRQALELIGWSGRTHTTKAKTASKKKKNGVGSKVHKFIYGTR